MLSVIEKNLFKRPIKPESKLILALLILMAIFSGVKECGSQNDQEGLKHSVDSISHDNKSLIKSNTSLLRNVNNLSRQYTIASDSYHDSLKSTAIRMSREFGEGVKHGDTNTITILTDALANKKQLQHTIDSMSHKLDTLQNGFVDVTPGNNFINIDSAVNGKRLMSHAICNNGNRPIKDVEIDVRIVLLSDLSHAIPHSFFRSSFSANDCEDFHDEFPKLELGTFYFIYRIKYKYREVAATDYFTVAYSKELKRWGIPSSRFGHLFKD